MRFLLASAVAAALLGSFSTAALAQTKGDWVLGNYKGAGYWYPGIISSVQGSKITIQYDDGDTETLAISETRPYNWAIGKKVECNFKGQGKWYPGKISSLAGEKIGIAYDDGDKETTKTGRCRSS
ncbi:tudor domain-containing protein [Rhizobium rhizoryzae]|uniref:tudor domain-containing protein n=1 Tax=Rhizobium rhizoryzae TaxID=451876 RepID=UPI00289A06FE|nr:tudor domain-containing protein [Rhizobium rhizoryzae]